MARKKPAGPPFDTILFDCDSTLSAVEGIDELARWAGCHAEIAELTRAAMEGRLSLEDIYRRRLEMIRPDRQALNALGQLYCERLVPEAEFVITHLQCLGKTVHIISGGLWQAVYLVGCRLRVADENIHAVSVSLDSQGNYLGFAEDSPLTRSGGKAALCQQILAKTARTALVGDGITDLETAAAGVFIVGFGGVARREVMVRQADVFVEGPSLREVLPQILTNKEQALPWVDMRR